MSDHLFDDARRLTSTTTTKTTTPPKSTTRASQATTLTPDEIAGLVVRELKPVLTTALAKRDAQITALIERIELLEAAVVTRDEVPR